MAGVDGLRAFAALWVVLYHMEVYSRYYFHQLPGVDFVARSGFLGVSLFLVLSGFCLYMPFAGGRTNRFGARPFLWRRCMRLLPAYYVSLVFALLLAYAAGKVTHSDGLHGARDALWQTVTHVTMTHSLFPNTFYALNGAYWSLGLEWQLYLLLPVLVLGVRGIGLKWTVSLAAACSVAYVVWLQLAIHGGIVRNPFLIDPLLPRQLLGRWTEFLLGMVAAELFATGRAEAWAVRVRWPALALAPVALWFNHEPWTYLVSGFVFFGLLLQVLAARSGAGRVFGFRPLAALGIMSYSLYLVHQPLIAFFAYGLRVKVHASPMLTFAGLVALLPVVFAAMFILFAAVERRTLYSSGRVPPVREFVPAPLLRLSDTLFRREAGAGPNPMSEAEPV